MDELLKLFSNPRCHEEGIVQGDKYRFSVLTDRMIRMEYSEEGIFEDRSTQSVINRSFPVPSFEVIDQEDNLEIITEAMHLIYNKKEFSKEGLKIKVYGNLGIFPSVWYYSQEINDLKGTARTLDNADGEIPLDRGLISREGFSIIDDSKSLIINEDGWVEPRRENIVDTYFLGYGRSYLDCLQDFFKLCGRPSMLPRYALGNWWSRFYRYTDKEYLSLMDRFKKEGIPLSVAVIDMDWHLVDIDPKYGSGWTGYTWNRELFQNPEEFMASLHKENLKVTLNVHPAEGVRPHEEMYEEMAKDLGVDYKKEEEIQFNISDKDFLKAYFKHVHHPNERQGVDFWWIDWQQGTTSKVKGLDPLWMLNHYHYLDSSRDGKRPITFSRYAGIGSHRYGIGFSGDTIISWKSLDFQPYFTSAASNVGYGWWSHDIGGHMGGIKDDELATRWMQFGVFSPIMRLHSSSSVFNSKEPWRYNRVSEGIMKSFLRLRHKLIPFIYTMNRRFYEEGRPLVQPMYYHNSEVYDAYEVKNQYYFGENLIVCPITSPVDKSLGRGKAKAWLPEGNFIDIFTGMIYKGNRTIDLYRDLYTIPVLAKCGTILPLAAEETIENDTSNPEKIELRVYAGDSGSFTLYEDDGETLTYQDGKYVETDFDFKWGEDAVFTINPSRGEAVLIPENRSYQVKIIGIKHYDSARITLNNEEVNYKTEYKLSDNTLVIDIPEKNADDTIIIELSNVLMAENNIKHEIFKLLDNAQIEFELKDRLYKLVNDADEIYRLMGVLNTMDLQPELLGAMSEILTAS